MKILMINSVCGFGSTGRICAELAEQFEKEGHEVKIAYGRKTVSEKYQKYAVRIGTKMGVRINSLKARILDNEGLNARHATQRFLKWATEFNPDMLWIHNLHGYYLNYEMLFKWIKSRPDMEVKWTLHDCWAFTGHCAYYSFTKCDKWKTGCRNCPEKHSYPASYFWDSSRSNYKIKKELFTGIPNLQIITPSKWLADEVQKSFLSEYPVSVVNNKIDTSVFTPAKSDFKSRYGLEGKTIVLGVASRWTERKGLFDFYKLSEKLDDSYQIILVGISEKQKKELPKKILGICRTNSKSELAEIYSSADVFINPTYQENYPTVNLEAEACGTDVITYDTGGSRETVKRQGSCVVEIGDLDAVIKIMQERKRQI